MRGLHGATLLFSVAIFAGSATAGGLDFSGVLTGAQSVPAPVSGLIEGADIKVRFDEGFTEATVRLDVVGGDNGVAAHFHCARAGEPGPLAAGIFSPGPLVFDGASASGTLTNADVLGGGCEATIGRTINNLVSLALAMRDGLIYVNVHTIENLGGEVRAQLLER